MKKVLCLVWITGILSQSGWCAVLTADDAVGTSSFNSPGNWDNGLPPGSDSWYCTQGYTLRTPNVAGNYTFGADYLVVGGGDGGGANPFLTDGMVNLNCLINKTPGNPVIMVGYLELDMGYIRDGMGSSDAWTLDGYLSVSPNGGGLACQGRFDINSQIVGYGPLYIADNGTDDSRRVIYINNFNNEYRGSIHLLGFAQSTCRLTFSPPSRMNFVWENGAFNSITGIGTVIYDGAFRFDPWLIHDTPGVSWVISDVSSQTFGPSFYVINAQPVGNGVWLQQHFGIIYSFDQNTGLLTCLGKPATLISPNGGERYVAGQTVEIKYTTATAPMTSTVSLVYMCNGGVGWGLIAEGVPNTGTYLWTTPDLGYDSDSYIIQVMDDAYSGFVDESDAFFTVFRCPEFNPADINKDCYIDLQDVAMLAQSWLWCRDPYNPACSTE